jgi:hypothetical protein
VSVGTFITVVLAGAAATGFWLTLRLDRFAPRSPGGAARMFALGLLVPVLGRPLLDFALVRLPPGEAVLLVLFPLLVCSFAATAMVLRYLVGLAASRVR